MVGSVCCLTLLPAVRVLRRLVTLLSKQASLEASNEAAMRQAVSASNAAQKVGRCVVSPGPRLKGSWMRICVEYVSRFISLVVRVILFSQMAWRQYSLTC